MAKTKVFELAKELGIHSKDVITFLQGKGVEAKAAQSSIEDDATAMVKKHFGKSEGEKRVVEEASMKTTGVTPEKKTENTQNENHGKQEQVQTAAAQPSAAAQPAAEHREGGAADAPVKKKKNINFCEQSAQQQNAVRRTASVLSRE